MSHKSFSVYVRKHLLSIEGVNSHNQRPCLGFVTLEVNNESNHEDHQPLFVAKYESLCIVPFSIEIVCMHEFNGLYELLNIIIGKNILIFKAWNNEF